MPAVARGDGVDSVRTNHKCDRFTNTDTCSSNVFVNGTGVVRLDDKTKPHKINRRSSCRTHQPSLTVASPNVFVNGKGVGRLRDNYEGEDIVTASPNVFAN